MLYNYIVKVNNSEPNTLTERCIMKKTIRITAFLLALLMLLASCSEKGADKEEDTSTETETTSSETTEQAETEPEIETASKKIEKKFANTSYSGKTFTMLGYDSGQHYYNNISSTFNEIWADGYTGEIINDAVFDRNSKTEVLLDIKLEHLFNSNIPNMIKQAVSSSSNDFTAALGSLSGLGSSFEAGELANLMNFENIDTTAEWYDKNCVDTFTLFGDRLYWLTGDYMLCDDYAVHVFFYNKNIIENNGFDQPYAMVEEGKWTMDYFDTLVNACVRDVDGNGTIDINSDKDIVGLIGNADEPKHWIYGAREKSIEIDDEGSFVVNTLSERHINVAEKIYRILVEDKVFYNSSDPVLNKAFTSGRAVAYDISLALINIFRDMPDEFGILPYPKYEESQENYGHYISNFVCTAIVCPKTVEDRDFAGACIEALSAYSTETVNSGLYDTLLASKLVRDTESVDMLKICLETKYFDWAVDFQWVNTFLNAYNAIYGKKNFEYVSDATKNLKLQNMLLEKILNKVKNFED